MVVILIINRKRKRNRKKKNQNYKRFLENSKKFIRSILTDDQRFVEIIKWSFSYSLIAFDM